jgi:flagellar basal-body rod modification protein FlgD
MSDSVGITAQASDLQMNFMNLLVTQLKNQDPMKPMDSQDMSAQLAQFTQLQQLEEMNGSFGQALELAERNYASSLIGKDVSFNLKATDGTLEETSGQVEEVVLDSEGEVELIIGDQNISLADVLAVRG